MTTTIPTADETASNSTAHFDAAVPAIVIDGMTVTDGTVIAEVRRWIDGRIDGRIEARTTSAAPESVDPPDVTEFVAQALTIGAHAIGAAGSVRQAVDVQALLTEVETRTTRAGQDAAAAAGTAASEAARTVGESARQAKLAIDESSRQTREAFRTGVDAARTSLTQELDRLLGGDNPELATRLQPLLTRFSSDLVDRARTQSEQLLAKVTQQFDTTDPTSPMAQQARTLATQHDRLEKVLTDRHGELSTQVGALSTAVTALTAVRTATDSLRRRTPVKGGDYEDEIGVVLRDIAAGLGDEYVDTRSTTGVISRNKKGDGLLQLSGLDARIVIEAKDTAVRVGWRDYLDEAERNRGAVASLGLAKSAAALDGQTFLVLGPRRLVMVFDPETDDPALLRTVVQVLRMSAMTAGRQDSVGVVEAGEKLTAALAALARFSELRKVATDIVRKAESIDSTTTRLESDLRRLLTDAQAALISGADLPAAGHQAA